MAFVAPKEMRVDPAPPAPGFVAPESMQVAPAEQVAQAVDQPGLMDDAARLTNQFTAGFNSFLADAIEAAELLTGGRPPEGVDVVTLKQQAANALRGRAPEATTTAERAAREAGRFLGENLLPAAGISTLARGVAAPVAAGMRAASPTTASLGQRAREGIVAAQAQAPRTLLTTETASATGAGAGGQIAAEAFGDRARSAGEMAGAVAPSIPTPTGLVTRGARAVAGRFMTTPQQLQRRAMANVGETLAEPLSSDFAQRQLRRAQAVQGEVPGLEPTLAEATGLPSLVRTQQALEQTSSGADLDRFMARRAANAQAVDDFAAARAPDATADADQIANAATERIQRLTGDVGLRQQELRQSRELLADRLRPVDRTVTGNVIRRELDAERKAVSNRMSDLAEQIGLNDLDLAVPFAEFRQAVRGWREGLLPSQLDALPAALRDVDAIGTDAVRFPQIKALRESVTDEMRDVMRSTTADRRKRLRNLAQLRQLIDEQLLGRIGEAAPTLRADYERFRQRYQNELIRPFERGAVRRVAQMGTDGAFRTLDEDVAEAFLGSREAARQFMETLGSSPAARDAMVAAVLDRLGTATVRDGVIEPKRLETWMRQHREVLDEMPFLRERIGEADRLNDALIRRQATLTSRQRAIENSVLARRINALSRGTSTPEQVIEGAVRNPAVMRTLLRSLPAPAKVALQRQVWDYAAGLEPGQLAQFMDRNERSLTRLLGRDHMRDLITIQAARVIANRVPPSAGQPISVNPMAALEAELGIELRSLASRYANLKTMRLSPQYVGTDLFGRALRAQTALENDRLLREALFNPQIARNFADMVVIRRNAPQRLRRLRAALFTVGARALSNELTPGEGDRP